MRPAAPPVGAYRYRASVTTRRCGWAAGTTDPEMLAYHDQEWGVPSHDDRQLFEMLTLEGAQAGLSWSTILHKREGYRRAFAGFDVDRVARFDARSVARLLRDPGIVRNRLKVGSTVANARAIRSVRDELGSLDALLWSFVGGSPVRNRWRGPGDIPSETDASRAMSKDLKRRGFRFVGPTVCYAFMQATGMVNDHEVRCFRFPGIEPRVD
jgi:DNA-3-methyladenine glycosylase I